MRLLDDASLRAAIVVNNHHIVQQFTPGQVATDYLETYISVIDQLK